MRPTLQLRAGSSGGDTSLAVSIWLLSQSRSLTELGNLQSSFLSQFANGYMQETEKLAKPVAGLAGRLLRWLRLIGRAWTVRNRVGREKTCAGIGVAI